jgi:translocation and assembly module TamB
MAVSSSRKTGFGRKIAIGVISIVVVLAVAIGFLGFTRSGTVAVLKLAAPFLSTTDRTVTISDAGPLLTGHLRAGKITVADSKGVYAEIDGLAIDWSPLSLASLTFDASSIAANRVRRPLARNLHSCSKPVFLIAAGADQD